MFATVLAGAGDMPGDSFNPMAGHGGQITLVVVGVLLVGIGLYVLMLWWRERYERRGAVVVTGATLTVGGLGCLGLAIYQVFSPLAHVVGWSTAGVLLLVVVAISTVVAVRQDRTYR